MWMLKSRLMTTRTKSKDTFQHFVSVNVMTACLLNKQGSRATQILHRMTVKPLERTMLDKVGQARLRFLIL